MSRTIKRPGALLLLVCLAAALACNLPVAIPRSPSQAEQETLAAHLFPSATSPGDPPAPANTVEPTLLTPPPGQATIEPVPAGQPFAGLILAVPGQIPAFISPLLPEGTGLEYQTQPGDTLAVLTLRFTVDAGAIQPSGLPMYELLPPGTRLFIPPSPADTLPTLALLPDSEVVYGPPAADFDIQAAVDAAGGYLSTYSETVEGVRMTGAEAVRRIALETSTNPRLLLAMLEFRAGWVSGSPRNAEPDYPIGFYAPSHPGLYKELALVTRQLTQAYYGWRSGNFTRVGFVGGSSARPDPRLNAGSVALQNLFASLYNPADWLPALYGENGFLALYARMFGDPWARAAAFEPHLPGGLGYAQSDWQLPFAPGEKWSFTSGPHLAWGVGSPLGALDFAPADEGKGCYTSARWATASMPGVVARSERGLLVLDADGDGREQTGWTLLYLHLADAERLPVGAQVGQDERLGHPSCEGGPATGKHIHLVRKYNGEWIGVSQVFPFVLSGWLVEAGELPYQGRLLKDGRAVDSRPDGSAPALIVRE
jgi:LasA protease